MNLKVICTLVFLGGNAWKDWRKREISIVLVIAYALCGVISGIVEKRGWTDWLMPLAIGLMFVALGVLTKGSIGLGDGWLLLALGCLLSAELYVKTLMIGLLLAAGWSGVLLIVCKKNRKTEIPLVPFLLLGYIGGLAL